MNESRKKRYGTHHAGPMTGTRETGEKAAAETGAIVTVEEAQVMGGLGGAVAETLVKNKPVPVEMMAIFDTFLECGTPSELAAKYKLIAADIAEAVQKVLKRK